MKHTYFILISIVLTIVLAACQTSKNTVPQSQFLDETLTASGKTKAKTSIERWELTTSEQGVKVEGVDRSGKPIDSLQVDIDANGSTSTQSFFDSAGNELASATTTFNERGEELSSNISGDLETLTLCLDCMSNDLQAAIFNEANRQLGTQQLPQKECFSAAHSLVSVTANFNRDCQFASKTSCLGTRNNLISATVDYRKDCLGTVVLKPEPSLPSGDVDNLRIEPSAVLFTDRGQSETLIVKAYDEGKEVSAAGLGLEWLNSDSTTVQVNQDPNKPHIATIRSLKDLGSATLSVRSRVNKDLISPPLNITIAKVKAGVKLINDNEVIFPPTNAPRLTTPAYLESIASDITSEFSANEIFSLFEISASNLFRYPVLLKDTTLNQGDLVLARQSSGVLGRVISVEVRGDTVLAELEEVPLLDFFDDFEFNFDSEALLEQGVLTPSSLATLVGADSLIETLSTEGLKCEQGGGLELTLEESSGLETPEFIAKFTVDKSKSITGFLLGVKLGLLAKATDVGITPQFNTRCSIPLEDPLSYGFGLGITETLLAARIEAAPVFAVSGDFKNGPSLKNGDITFGINLTIQVGFDLNKGNLSDVIFQTNVISEYELDPKDQLKDLNFNLDVEVVAEAKAGLQLFSKIFDIAEKIADFFEIDTAKKLVTEIRDSLFVQFLKGKLGPIAQGTWESAKRVIDRGSSRAGIDQNFIFELRLESPKLNFVLKKIGFSGVSVSFETEFATKTLQTVFEKDKLSVSEDLCPNELAKICVHPCKEVTFTIDVKYVGNPETKPNLADGEVWLNKIAPIDGASTTIVDKDTMKIKLIPDETICDQELNFLAYSKLWGIDTAGYAGNVKIECRNQGPTAEPYFESSVKNRAVRIDLTNFVSDPENDPLTLTLSKKLASNMGTASITGKIVTYNPPNRDFTGTVLLEYTATDPAGAFAKANITITLFNRPPVAQSLGVQLEENTLARVNIAALVSDADNDPITLGIFQGPTRGSFNFINSILTYRPDDDFVGIDSITYIATDSSLDSARATITFNVQENSDPIAVDNSFLIEDGPTTFVREGHELNVLLNDRDPDGDSFSLHEFSQPLDGNGVVQRKGDNLVYFPARLGTTTFTYTIKDSAGNESNKATVTVRIFSRITPPPPPPPPLPPIPLQVQ